MNTAARIAALMLDELTGKPDVPAWGEPIDLRAIARALLEYETLSGEEVSHLLRGETIDRSDPPDTEDQPQGRRGSVPSGGAVKRPGASSGGMPGLQPQG